MAKWRGSQKLAKHGMSLLAPIRRFLVEETTLFSLRRGDEAPSQDFESLASSGSNTTKHANASEGSPRLRETAAAASTRTGGQEKRENVEQTAGAGPASSKPVAKRRRAARGKPGAGVTNRRMDEKHRSALKQLLMVWREELAAKLNRRSFHVLPDSEVQALVDRVPTTREELCSVGSWRGARKLASYGVSLLFEVNSFLETNGVALRGKISWRH